MHIFLVEDDAAVAASLHALLKGYGYACTHFASGEAFLDWTGEPPACVLLDVRLPERDGLSVLASFRTQDPNTPVIIMTGHGDVAMAVEALQHGAQDFVEKPFDGDDLVKRIRSAVHKATPDIVCRRKIESLTPRERDVLREIVAGHLNKVIAHNLGISPKTVELHRARVMDKTGSRNVSQLIQTALRGGVKVDDPA